MPYRRADTGLEDLLAKVESLRPLVEAHRQALSKGPDLPAPIAQAFLEAGFGLLWAPVEMGGAELPLPDFLRVVEALSKLDGSLGWCAGISAAAMRILGVMDRAGFGDGRFPTLLGGGSSFTARGRAVREGEGWRLDGLYTFVSFSRYADVVVLTFVEHENGAPKMLEEGGPALRMFALAPDEIEVLNNWSGSGLRASGSHDVICRDRWVHESRSLACAGLQLPRAPGRPLYDLSLVPQLAVSLTGAPLGIAAASLEAFAEIARTKTSFLQTAPLQEQEHVHLVVGRASARLAAARTHMYASAEKLWAVAEAGERPSVADQVAVRMAAWNAGDAAKQTVADLHRLAGVAVASDDSRLATAFRDVHLVAQHLHFADRLLVGPGRLALGLDPGAAFI